MIDLMEFDEVLLDYFTSCGKPNLRYLFILHEGKRALIAANLPEKAEALHMLRTAIKTITDNEPLIEVMGSA